MRSISVGLDREESGSDGLCLGLVVLATLAAGFVAGSDVLRCWGFGPATGDVCLWVEAGFWRCPLPGGGADGQGPGFWDAALREARMFCRSCVGLRMIGWRR
ncbi:hypothetical protein [Encephalitozoon cuniculi GB-M1]|uniref:Uncharacterized protein ECU01_0060/ECU01_1550/ECU02_1580/ECU04_0070/ ECU08_2110 n=1 Tax=Encephalitozoon cuniculi (strain GB-M1) TaxID=284813 RepID=Y106_ENCCU|nr:uncharacterized protein ECU01_0060 [Encephalitozoon cuniculi GB-M1]NP_001402241.1 uncharacterized protein ECU01_1550 [Encephalitozoon cuniculi GB-M1]NP_584683.1 uncharacterized protein ECU02_1580 [Encephalitozoon cuniculi GB-M1]NP_584690.1 uncharacterized protein ECU04_0070 [Encephalitozoon cuniculi GB-M1]NP_597337.1 uncharacterized protein ECU08_2110 [Encephalitozoon cuniculi GB-M1]Q8ST79.1 RecName: Full=Uncharacterized protein ECU01_0060/ECU01_1550/ECU02_1580/ECU04_0070/ ECU08_2110 [Encep